MYPVEGFPFSSIVTESDLKDFWLVQEDIKTAPKIKVIRKSDFSLFIQDNITKDLGQGKGVEKLHPRFGEGVVVTSTPYELHIKEYLSSNLVRGRATLKNESLLCLDGLKQIDEEILLVDFLRLLLPLE